MLIEHLIKSANMLDVIGTEASIQASEGIDAVLQTYAASKDVHDYIAKALNNLESARSLASGTDPDLVEGIEGARAALTALLTPQDSTFEDEKTEPGLPAAMHVNPDFGSSEWKPEKAPFEAESSVLINLVKVATLLDSEGYTEAASIIDSIVKDAVELPKYPTRMETRQDLYDAPRHNQETMWEVTKTEVAENRKQHHLETMRDSAKTLSTRYSPELPGVPTVPVAPGVVQDYLTKKVYDFNTGFTLSDGTKQPGGSVKNQTPLFTQYSPPTRLFDR